MKFPTCICSFFRAGFFPTSYWIELLVFIAWWLVLIITSVLLLHLCFFGFQCGEDLLQHLASGEHFVANRDVCDVSGLWDRIEGSIVRPFSPRLTLPREE